MKQLVLASNNPGKIKEFSSIFKAIGIEIIPQAKLNVPEVDEPYFTFIENALHKARHCSKITGLPALADDSGLCVNALDGQPGVFSARFAGEPRNDVKNNIKLVEEMQSHTDKSAHYYCILVMVRSFEDPQPIIADGYLYGEIVDTAQGSGGFGYNPHFYLPEYKMTMAELDDKIRNQISHRALAIKSLLDKLDI
ncbi:MAG: nucleoside-triphosphate diphosphatase [Burkholderiales bacterium]|jgi:XTP/dITP diphosphohydrolase|nr:nucleoside-triphosphate diphosphatase [Burkholderiales bacterium]